MLLVALVGVAQNGCSSAGVFRKRLVFQQEELQQKIEGVFPLQKRKSLLTATLSGPRVLLAEGSDRLGIGLAVKAGLRGGKKHRGEVEVDGELEYRSAQASLFVIKPRVRRLRISDLPSKYQDPVREVVDALVQAYLSEILIYQLKQGDHKHSLAKLVLRAVQVEDGALVVELGL